MAQTDENSIDQLLDRVHRDTEQVKNAVGPGDAAALAGVAAGMDQIAKDIASVAGGEGGRRRRGRRPPMPSARPWGMARLQ